MEKSIAATRLLSAGCALFFAALLSVSVVPGAASGLHEAVLRGEEAAGGETGVAETALIMAQETEREYRLEFEPARKALAALEALSRENESFRKNAENMPPRLKAELEERD